MRDVVLGQREADFHEARHFELPIFRRIIRDGDSADFGIVLRRNDDLGMSRSPSVVPEEFDFILGKRHFVDLWA